jgi:pilus assembly protein Flp/PilA
MTRTEERDLVSMIRRRLEREDGDCGAAATEYAILVALIAIVIGAGITLFGTQLEGWFSTMAGQLP